MAFFYGLVSQRGPWQETAADYLRLTRPQFQDAVDPNTSNEANTEKLRMQQRTSGVIGSRGSDLRAAPAINGLEKSLGISNELVNVFAQKAMDETFTNGSSGGPEQTYIVADFLTRIRQSTMYNHAIPILEKALAARLESTKDRVPFDDFQKLEKLVFGVDMDRKTATALISATMGLADRGQQIGIEAAQAEVLAKAPTRLRVLIKKIFDNQLVLPSATQLYMEAAPNTPEVSAASEPAGDMLEQNENPASAVSGSNGMVLDPSPSTTSSL